MTVGASPCEPFDAFKAFNLLGLTSSSSTSRFVPEKKRSKLVHLIDNGLLLLLPLVAVAVGEDNASVESAIDQV